MTDKKCCCPVHDAYACWTARYQTSDVDEDGGPCDCGCHYDDEDDDVSDVHDEERKLYEAAVIPSLEP
jgi:hypothetical protein